MSGRGVISAGRGVSDRSKGRRDDDGKDPDYQRWV